MASLAEQLAEVETAITAALSAQSYGVGSRRVERADISALFKRRDELQDRINRESSGGVFRIIQLERPT